MYVCLHSNSNRTEYIKSKLGAGLVLGKDWKPIYFGPKRSKVKVTGSKKVKILLLLLYASLFKLGSSNFSRGYFCLWSTYYMLVGVGMHLF